jgi:chemotaxis protein methyltransferase CheR
VKVQVVMMNGKSFNSPTIADEREFVFTEKDFEQLKKIVSEHTGIVLTDAKRNMVYGRLARRLRVLGIGQFRDYIALVTADEVELINFINSITTNLTAFFREKHHFDHLKSDLFPKLVEENRHTKRVRIWSAGCSTGEEPYSLAITVREFFSAYPDWDVKILATDIDTNVLAKASSAIYSEDRVEDLDKAFVKRWFVRGKGDKQGFVKLRNEVSDLISFKQLNLLQSWPMRGPFDLIFCRNVVIYFDKPTKVKLFDRYADILVPTGHIFIGHSETLFKISERFTSLGGTIYQKKT